MVLHINLGNLDDVDLSAKLPSDQDVLTFDGTKAKWSPKKPAVSTAENFSNSYVIELSRWNIRNDGTTPAATRKGINDAIVWAKSQGYNHVVLPGGRYKLRMDETSFSCIVLQSGVHFQMADLCVLELEANSSPWYRIIQAAGLSNVKISGGKLVGDKKNHIYQLGVKFVRGGVNADGSLNSNPNFIRSEVIDRYANPGLLTQFRLWAIGGVNVPNYSFYQYKDAISAATLVGFRSNGGFAPSVPAGRGWFAPIQAANKMVFTVDITSSPLTDAQIAQINAKLDSLNWTHEWGHGIEIDGSNTVEIDRVEVSDCTGDAVITAWLTSRLNPADYKQEEMGSYIHIHHCNLHNCRRQGISLTGSTDIFIENNKIHHIGKADNDVTVDGTAPCSASTSNPCGPRRIFRPGVPS